MAGKCTRDFYRNLSQEQQSYVQSFRTSYLLKKMIIKGTPWHYYDSENAGPTLLLLHGGFTDFSMWIHQIIAFEKDFRVIAPTCPVLPQATMKTYSGGLNRILHSENAYPVFVMGYSEGGLIA